jgi:hypothetical protein
MIVLIYKRSIDAVENSSFKVILARAVSRRQKPMPGFNEGEWE